MDNFDKVGRPYASDTVQAVCVPLLPHGGPYTPYPQLSTFIAHTNTLNSQPSTLNPILPTLNPQPFTINS